MVHVSQRLRALSLCVLSALLAFLASEPVGLAPLGLVALLPLYVAAFRTRRARWGFVYGLAAGVAFFAAHLSWIFLFGWMAWTSLSLVLALYWAGAIAIATVVRRFPLAPVLAAGAWGGFELLRDRWPFGGFSWGSIGTSQAGTPGVRWLAGAVGVYGLSFLCAFVAAVVADRIVHRTWAWGSVALVAAATLAFAGLDAVRYAPDRPGRPVDVALVQGDVPRPVRPDQRAAILRSHAELTRRLRPGEADVVVWPEDAIGIGAPGASLDVVSDLATSLDTHLLVGHSDVDVGAGTFTNAVSHVSPDGAVQGTYEKRHPVPFGEYVPLTSLRRFVSTLDQVPYDLARGDDVVVFDVGGTAIATPICFESVFPRDVRAFAREGAEMHVFVTNDASFERSFASRQHLAHARMRALELRQWTSQVALSGLTAVVAPDGRVSETTELFEPALVRTTMRARPASSLYARTGDLFPAAWAFGTLVAIALWWTIVAAGRRGRRTAPGVVSADEPPAAARERSTPLR